MFKVLTERFDSLALAISCASEQDVLKGVVIHVVDYRGAVIWTSR